MDNILETTTQIMFSGYESGLLWALIVGIVLAFLLGFGMGANDVANAFGTSVGSKVVTIVQAYILATIFETLGSILVGYAVTDTMRKSVVDVSIYANDTREFMLGQVAILGGCAAWLLIATIFSLPVSCTHSIVGATLGFTILCKGFQGVVWKKILKIVASWFLSPMLSGTISSILYLLVDHVVLRRKDPLEAGFKLLPIFYFFCLGLNAFMVLYDGSPLLHFNLLPLWLCFAISLAIGTVAALIVQFLVKPVLRRRLSPSSSNARVLSSTNNEQSAPKMGWTEEAANEIALGKVAEEPSIPSKDEQPSNAVLAVVRKILPDRDREECASTLQLFAVLQLCTACYAGFAHGANDVSNAIAPLTALIALYKGDVNQNEQTPIYVLLFGVFSICAGLWCLGHKVILTVGTHMSEVTPASGFTIEFGAALTALIASKLGLPISTTHCLVGSVVAVGSIKSGKGVNWGIFRNVALSWVVTLPASGAIAAGIMFLLKTFAM